MEFFDLVNIAQTFTQYFMTYSPEAGLSNAEHLARFIEIYRRAIYIGVGVGAGIYLLCLIMGGIGMHVMAKKRGMKHSFLAFLPFVNTWYAGKLAGDGYLFGKKVRHMGLYAAILEVLYVAASAFGLVILFLFLQPAYCDPILTETGAFAGAQFVEEKLPVAMRWLVTADLVCEILTYVFYLALIFCLCILFYSFFRKYYARSPFIMTFLSVLLPVRGIVIFAVRNNTPVDYEAWMRRRMEQMRRAQGGGGYAPRDGYGQGDAPGGAAGPDPFSDFGGDAKDKDDDPFSDF